MVDANTIITLLIVAATQLIKMAVPTVQGWLTVIVALLLGVLIAVVDVYIGVVDISIAQGLVLAGAAIGLSSLAKKAAGNA